MSGSQMDVMVIVVIIDTGSKYKTNNWYQIKHLNKDGFKALLVCISSIEYLPLTYQSLSPKLCNSLVLSQAYFSVI